MSAGPWSSLQIKLAGVATREDHIPRSAGTDAALEPLGAALGGNDHVANLEELSVVVVWPNPLFGFQI
jgi:hypothetical protein